MHEDVAVGPRLEVSHLTREYFDVAVVGRIVAAGGKSLGVTAGGFDGTLVGEWRHEGGDRGTAWRQVARLTGDQAVAGGCRGKHRAGGAQLRIRGLERAPTHEGPAVHADVAEADFEIPRAQLVGGEQYVSAEVGALRVDCGGHGEEGASRKRGRAMAREI